MNISSFLPDDGNIWFPKSCVWEKNNTLYIVQNNSHIYRNMPSSEKFSFSWKK
jgi:hypothetical protein